MTEQFACTARALLDAAERGEVDACWLFDRLETLVSPHVLNVTFDTSIISPVAHLSVTSLRSLSLDCVTDEDLASLFESAFPLHTRRARADGKLSS